MFESEVLKGCDYEKGKFLIYHKYSMPESLFFDDSDLENDKIRTEIDFLCEIDLKTKDVEYFKPKIFVEEIPGFKEKFNSVYNTLFINKKDDEALKKYVFGTLDDDNVEWLMFDFYSVAEDGKTKRYSAFGFDKRNRYSDSFDYRESKKHLEDLLSKIPDDVDAIKVCPNDDI